MKQSIIRMSKITRYGSLMTALLGIVHVLATGIVYHSGGFERMSAESGMSFLFMFISTGLGLIFIGSIAAYSSFAVMRGEKWAFHIVSAAGAFVLLVGLGAVFALPHNPFAYLTFVAALMILLPLIVIKKSGEM